MKKTSYIIFNYSTQSLWELIRRDRTLCIGTTEMKPDRKELQRTLQRILKRAFILAVDPLGNNTFCLMGRNCENKFGEKTESSPNLF